MAEPAVNLIDLAARVSDGTHVDWDRAERSAASEEERRIVHQLRLVDGVAGVHRSQGEPVTSRDALELSAAVAATASLDPTVLDPEPEETVPRSWGHLRIRERIGEGAFGEVFRAWDANLDREVALKLLKTGPSAKGDLASTMLEEGRLLARVRHPNVVTVHGAEAHDGRVGLWMEFVRGLSLADLLEEQGRLGAREATLIGLDLCRALAAVHGAGLVHRDIKARNVMREEGGRILLMDFGAGREMGDEEGPGDRTITGTPLYIAPEVYAHRPATARSDIYSLGVLLYHLVTGSYPVRATTLHELRDKHRRREMRLLRDERSDLPEGFVNVVERALEGDPAGRFATAGQMEQALSAALGVERAGHGPVPDPPYPRPTPLRYVAAMATLIVAALAVVFLFPTPIGDRQVDPSASVATGAAATYTVEAALHRVVAEGRSERLESGARLELGDQLYLEFEASRDLHVYVINEDEQGRAYVLFPLPGVDLRNPLRAHEMHSLPGRRDGTSREWEVTTRGGTEHLLLLASPERLAEFEAEMSKLPRAGDAETAVEIPETAKTVLRGIGGLAEARRRAPEGTAGRLFEMADEMAGRSEKVEGAWVRRIVLKNPAP
jgi:serine/threonine-protein kinase